MRNRTRQRGVAAVEFAFLLTFILVPVAFGITEFGRALYQYNTLDKATRDAARYLSTQAAGTGIGIAQCLAVYGTQDCSGQPLAPGLTVANVNICDAISCPSDHIVSTSLGSFHLVTVSIGGGQANSYQFFSIVPFIVPDINFGPISTTMRQDV